MKPLPYFDNYINSVTANRTRLQRVFFTLALISLLFNYRFHLLLHQIGSNPLLYQEIDPVYWLFMLLQLPQIIIGPFAVAFDIALLVSCCCCIIWPRKALFPLLFFILHFIYFILYNMLSGHHYISIGLLLMSVPFVMSNAQKFAFFFLFIRFAFCFGMFTAALWKIGRGALFYTHQLYALYAQTFIEELALDKGNFRFMLVRWQLQHPWLTHAAWVFMILLELLFILGFLSFKWDKLLLVCYLLFYVGGWLLLNIYNYDNLLFLLTLTPVLYAATSPQLLLKRKQTFAPPM